MLNEQKAFKTVCFWDQAIDAEAMGGAKGVIAWSEAGRDFSKLIFHEGAKPVVYHLRTLPAMLAHNAMLSTQGEHDQAMRMFRACLLRVDNHPFIGDLSFEPARVRDKQDRLDRTSELVSDMEANKFDLLTMYEIGGVARGLSFFPRGITPTFAVPLLSAQIWDAARGLLRAEQAQTTAENGNSE